MWLMFASAPAVIWGISFILSPFDLSFDTVGKIMLPFMGVMLVLGLRSLLIGCPACGRSLFLRDYGIGLPFASPWPSKQCGKCGRDLTKP
jgi:hypothetical protein